jgi:hypothetical protein
MSNTPGLEASVADWLEKTGYRLEYQTHSAFVRAGLVPTMAFHVKSAEGKIREIDVAVAEMHGRLLLKVLCECKYSTGKPWVLLSSDLPPFILADWMALPKSRELADFPIDEISVHKNRLEKSWHFNGPSHFAHSIILAHVGSDKDEKRKDEKRDDDNRDFAFKSLQKIANTAWDYVAVAERPEITDRPLLFS